MNNLFNYRTERDQSTENSPQDSEYKFSGIRRRRCCRYIPVDPDEKLREFLRDRYRHTSLKGTPPSGPFCSCGLQRDEHKKDAIDAAPADVANRELRIAENWYKKQKSQSLQRQEQRTRSPQSATITKSSNWNVLTDTIEEPTDVNIELTIPLEQHHQEFSESISLENLALAPRVNLIFSTLCLLLYFTRSHA